MEKTVCAYCGKKGCHNKCRTDWDIKMSNLQLVEWDLDELDYKVRKLYDAYEEVKKEIDKQMEENQLLQEGLKKQKPKPVKKTG